MIDKNRAINDTLDKILDYLKTMFSLKLGYETVRIKKEYIDHEDLPLKDTVLVCLSPREIETDRIDIDFEDINNVGYEIYYDIDIFCDVSNKKMLDDTYNTIYNELVIKDNELQEEGVYCSKIMFKHEDEPDEDGVCHKTCMLQVII